MSEEKTFAPTEKRRRDAALKGDVLRSGLTWDREAVDHFAPGAAMIRLSLAVFPPILTLAVAIMVAVSASQLASADGRWVGSNALPKASRLNPLSGFKRMFGAQGWIEVGKGVLKVLLLGTICYAWAGSSLAALFALGRAASLGGALREAWGAIIDLLFALAAGLAVIALVDWPVQWLRRFLRLRMSQQEMRDEHKESDGSPERKAAQRQRQREYASGAVAKAMREAQFVLTNPTHFSVAMGYDPAKAGAPVVLAKGRGEKALAMRELARELEVPLLEVPALARSVYFTTRENQMIREELYGAVAAVLAYVFSLRRGEARAMPPIDVPVALRFDAEGRLEENP